MGEGFPLWSLVSMAWEGRGPLRDWICLSVSLFLRSQIWPFTVSFITGDPPIGLNFGHDLYPEISFLAAKEGLQPPYGVSTRAKGAPRGVGAPPASWPPRAPSRVDSSSHISQIFQKYSPSVFIMFGLRLIWIFCETKTCNKQELALGTGSIC